MPTQVVEKTRRLITSLAARVSYRTCKEGSENERCLHRH